MDSNLTIGLWLRLHGNDAAAAGIRRFTDTARTGFGQVGNSVKQAWQDLNGFSAASKLLAAAGGVGLLRNALDANLEFEQKILEMKQLADMTQAQAAAMRKTAIERATDLLATPQDIAEGMRTLANAGMKYEQIAGTIEEAARAALAFRSSITDIANMDFDIQQKFHIDPSRMAAMHDMLYYHSKAGRFEAKSLSSYAPEYLNEMARVGMGGENALNFAGALTQVMQKIKPATQPGEVSTLIKHGLGHITDKAYVRHIKAATGIDVEKYMPDGKFYGEGGVAGMLDLAKALKAKGLDNPFKMSKAGFNDQYTRDFWLQIIKSIDEIEAQMKLAQGAAGEQTLDRDVAEIRHSNFGRIKKGAVQVEKAKLGEGATQGADWAGRMSEYFADHSGQVLAGAAGVGALALAFRYNRKRKDRLAGEAQATAAGEAGKVLGGMGVQRVFVTNWPGGMLGPGEALKQKQRGKQGGAGLPDMPLAPAEEAAAPKGRMGRTLGAAGKALGVVGAAASGWELGYNVIGPVLNEGINALVSAVTGKDNTLGGAIYDLLHKEQQPVKVDPIKVEVSVSNGNIVAAINDANTRQARRN
ncbi:phage tail tape measure protein [Chitinivorax sp. PXF-14]|uniref:phage tail tape measure protein n=1 Tax=Chitinivorax sp. PXF-14 TaxID=3230488 RepID=UPI0034662416